MPKTILNEKSTVCLIITILFTSNLYSLDIFYNPKLTGEKSMIQGISKAFAKLNPNEQLNKFNNLDKLHKAQPSIILTVGMIGFQLLQDKRFDKCQIIHVAHQIFAMHKYPTGTNTTFCLPMYLKYSTLANTTLDNTNNILWTNGIPNHIELQLSKKSFKQIPDKNLFPARVVIIGGDTRQVNGSWNIYTAKDASNLAKWLCQQRDNRPIIVLNGPRTSMHNKNGSLNHQAHKTDTIDDVTASFVNTVKQLQPGLIIHVYHFQYNKPSLYTGHLQAIKKLGGTIYIPGESNSMIQDIASENLSKQCVIYLHNAMDNTHQLNVLYMHKAYGIKIISFANNQYDFDLPIQQTNENPNLQIAHKLNSFYQ